MNPHTIIEPVTQLLVTRQRGNVCFWVDEHAVVDFCPETLFVSVLFVNKGALTSGRVGIFSLS